MNLLGKCFLEYRKALIKKSLNELQLELKSVLQKTLSGNLKGKTQTARICFQNIYLI